MTHPIILHWTRYCAFGVTGWDWQNQRSTYCTIDVDHCGAHVAGHADEMIADLLSRLMLVDQAEIIHSKGGKGLHIRLYFPPAQLPLARTRAEHITNCQRSLVWLSKEIDLDLDTKADARGVVAWIYHVDRQPRGFELVKRSTANLPADWDRELPAVQQDLPVHQDHPTTAKHTKVTEFLAQRGRGEWAGKHFRTHTSALSEAQDELKLAGSFATLATGKAGPTDRNCWIIPDTGGSFRVYRYGKNTREHESWWKSSSGWTTTWLNRQKDKSDPCLTLVELAKDDDLFHDSTGRTYTTTKIHGVEQTLQLTDPLYRAKLRLSYTQHTGRIVSRDSLATAIEQLSSTALKDRPEYTTSVRIAEHDGALYIDLADRRRQVVRLSQGQWSIVSESPIRFVRPSGLQPLPLPLPGGSLQELRKFVNIDDDELPLLMTFVIGCFHPNGPYPLLQVVGEQGSAKSSLVRFIHDLVDPNVAVGNTLPRDERDMLVAASSRWLISYDNLTEISRKLSDLFCMLVTGAASASRKLYTNDEQSILHAKRPIIVTAIKDVVVASDLRDRSLTLTLPTIPSESRKSESSIAEELRCEGVRGRILGYLLGGVAAAYKNHASVRRDDMPRLADIFSWITAAEPALGIPVGSAIAAFNRQAAEESKHVAASPLASAIRELCAAGFVGTASQIVDRFPHLELSAREASSKLREIAPDLRRQGCRITFRKSNGDRLVQLSMATTERVIHE